MTIPPIPEDIAAAGWVWFADGLLAYYPQPGGGPIIIARRPLEEIWAAARTFIRALSELHERRTAEAAARAAKMPKRARHTAPRTTERQEIMDL